MEGGLSDIWRYEEWRYLPVEDIISQCSTSKRMKEICDDPETWRYLLKRDFDITNPYTDEYRLEYMLERDKRIIMKEYPEYIDNVNRSLNDRIRGKVSNMKSIDLETGKQVYAFNNKYDFKTYDIYPLNSDEHIQEVFAYRKGMDRETERLYDLILSLIFDARPV
jgi:hypothetical protein